MSKLFWWVNIICFVGIYWADVIASERPPHKPLMGHHMGHMGFGFRPMYVSEVWIKNSFSIVYVALIYLFYRFTSCVFYTLANYFNLYLREFFSYNEYLIHFFCTNLVRVAWPHKPQNKWNLWKKCTHSKRNAKKIWTVIYAIF